MVAQIMKKFQTLLRARSRMSIAKRPRRKISFERLEDRTLLAATDPFVAALGDSLYSDSAEVGDASVDAVSNEVAWNLADYDYARYSLEVDADSRVVLYGIADDQKTELVATAVDADGELKLVGDDAKVETITIEASASTALGKIEYDGGSSKEDVAIVCGTENDDAFVLASESSDGDSNDDSSRGRWDRWGRDRNESKKSNDDVSVVSFSNEDVESASLYFKGVKTLTIDGAEGSDKFQIQSTSTDVSLVSDGDDALDFSAAELDSARSNRRGWSWGWSWGRGRIDGVTIDLNSTDWQEPAKNWSGRLRLEGDFVSVVGSSNNDKIIGSNVDVSETSGRNVVELTGGNNTVDLKSDGNSVTVAGTGTNKITVVGDDAKIDLTKTESTATNNVSVTGNRSRTQGGDAADVISVSGNRNRVEGGAGDDLIVASGSNNFARGDDGNDVVWAVGSSGRGQYSGGAGDDLIFGGSGNDWIFGGDGRDVLFGSTGWDEIDGGRESDLLVANRTDATSDFEDWDAEKRDAFLADLSKTWIEDQDLDATLELIGTSCLADGTGDCLWTGRNDEDRVLLNSSERDREWRGQSWDRWF